MEVTYYTDGVVWVTNRRVVFVETTYWLTEINRVEAAQVDSRRYLWLQLGTCLGILPLLLLLVALSLFQRNPDLRSCLSIGALVLVVCLALYFGRATYRLLSEPHDKIHVLRLHMRRGRIDAYCSLSAANVQTTVEAIMFAITRHHLNEAWTYLPDN